MFTEMIYKIWEIINTRFIDVTLFITLLAILWYSWETHKMRREMVDQKELLLLPIPNLEFKEVDQDYKLFIKNIGNKPMLNIKVQPFPLEIFDHIEGAEKLGEDFKKQKFHFEEISLLAPGQESEIKYDISEAPPEFNDLFKDKGGLYKLLGPSLNSRYAQRNWKTTISYENILNQKYETQVNMGKDGYRIIKTGKLAE